MKIIIFIKESVMNYNQLLSSELSDERIKTAITSLSNGGGVLLVDDENRENEGDLIFPAQTITELQMAMLIRECSGIVCLCLTEERTEYLALPMMVNNNSSRFQTAFTVSIEASEGVTTGVSAHDRVKTIRTAIDDSCKPEDLHKPGHVFPLRGRKDGVFERRGHTEGTIDLMKIAGLKPAGVLCELTNPDGTMSKLPEIIEFGRKYGFPVITIDDIVEYRKRNNC
jgi:3,4-dihydroxy 2-butanone 4-phosphate synthase